MIAPTLPFSPLRTEIAGIPVADLVREFGTPVFVYDAETILRRFGDLAAFDCVRYAQKACSNLAILDLVRRQGGLVDATSAGEIARALAAGFVAAGPAGEPPPIVYTAGGSSASRATSSPRRRGGAWCPGPSPRPKWGSTW